MEELLSRFWHELAQRPEGPMAFRFYLQPLMAIALAIHDGIKDARAGRPAYLFSLASEPAERRARLRDGWRSIGRVFMLAFGLDVIYQVAVLNGLRPVEGLVIALILAIVPYVLVRGPACRIAGHFVHRAHAPHAR
jgi:hypothetical protein